VYGQKSVTVMSFLSFVGLVSSVDGSLVPHACAQYHIPLYKTEWAGSTLRRCSFKWGKTSLSCNNQKQELT